MEMRFMPDPAWAGRHFGEPVARFFLSGVQQPLPPFTLRTEHASIVVGFAADPGDAAKQTVEAELAFTGWKIVRK